MKVRAVLAALVLVPVLDGAALANEGPVAGRAGVAAADARTAAGARTAAANAGPHARDTAPGEVFRFDDPAINEASGLVDHGDVMVTTNDSGSEPVLHVVDARTGRTVGRTRYTDRTVDVEALAPGPGSAVWVGDVGDNARQRASVRVYLVPTGRGEHRIRAGSFELVYPDRAHDAESLFTAPDGRLHVITKSVLGGAVFAAPAVLDPKRPNRLERVGAAPAIATDAASVPGTSLVLVRDYGSATIIDLATGDTVGRLDLPRQRQGEAISVGADDRIRVTSEGAHAAVIEVATPGWLTSRIASSRRTTAAAAGVAAGALGAMLGP